MKLFRHDLHFDFETDVGFGVVKSRRFRKSADSDVCDTVISKPSSQNLQNIVFWKDLGKLIFSYGPG